MAKRSYQDGCGAAQALDIVGERWALLVVRELTLGPRRYSDLLAAMPAIGTAVLAQRLADLVAAGVARRRALPAPLASRVYELTPWGAELEPVIRALGRWGAASPNLRRDLPISVATSVLALRTNVVPDRLPARDLRVSLRLDGRPFVAEVAGGSFTVEPGEAADVAATVVTDPITLARITLDGHPLEVAIADDEVRVDGDVDAAAALLGSFELPPVADTA
ncbi:winged helix-turn-helix transcriptional regulator [Agromyces bauzanensis]